jgi:hypothetical protein
MGDSSANSTLAIGALVPNNGNPTNGLIRQGQGIADTNFVWPALAISPRLGVAYDPTGRQPSSPAARRLLRQIGCLHATPAAGNLPTAKTSPFATASCRAWAREATTETPPALGGLWDTTRRAADLGAMECGRADDAPWAISLDVSYVGQHSWHEGRR